MQLRLRYRGNVSFNFGVELIALIAQLPFAGHAPVPYVGDAFTTHPCHG